MADAWKLTCGDCLDPVSGLASLPDKSVDCVITDPPYECAVWGHTRPGAKGGSRELASLTKMAEGAIGSVEPQMVAAQIARVSRRWVIVFYDAESVAGWSAALVENGMEHIRIGAWVKTNPMPHFSGDRPAMGYEPAAICHQPGRKKWNGSGAALWHFPTCSGDDRPDHPCPKPLPLMEQLVSDFSDPGDLILDPFAGSGTTGVAAIRLGRRFVGWERDPKYHAIATKRLAGTREQLVLPATRTKAKQERLL